MYVAQGSTADYVAFDVRLPGDRVAVPFLILTSFLRPDPILDHPARRSSITLFALSSSLRRPDPFLHHPARLGSHHSLQILITDCSSHLFLLTSHQAIHRVSVLVPAVASVGFLLLQLRLLSRFLLLSLLFLFLF